jgi:hypothetical protein
MTILESVDRVAVGHMLIAVIIIAGRVALDRMVPRGRFAARRAGMPVRSKAERRR